MKVLPWTSGSQNFELEPSTNSNLRMTCTSRTRDFARDADGRRWVDALWAFWSHYAAPGRRRAGASPSRLGAGSIAAMIRSATPDDIPTIASLIRALAEYEKLSHEVVLDEAQLREHLFGERRYAE